MKEPFLYTMFPDGWCEPKKSDYSARTEKFVIYSYYEKFNPDSFCEFCGEELSFDDDDDNIKDCDCEDAIENSSKQNFPKLSKMTLQSIIELLPSGVEPKDISIFTRVHYGDMGIYGHEIKFFYNKIYKDDPEGFKEAKKKFKANVEAYNIEKKKYDEWKKQQEIIKCEQDIKEIEKKLSALKGL